MKTKTILAPALVCGLIFTSARASATTIAGQFPTPLTPEQAREELAYTIGTQAYVYGYPWIYLSKLCSTWVTKPVNPAAPRWIE